MTEELLEIGFENRKEARYIKERIECLEDMRKEMQKVLIETKDRVYNFEEAAKYIHGYIVEKDRMGSICARMAGAAIEEIDAQILLLRTRGYECEKEFAKL